MIVHVMPTYRCNLYCPYCYLKGVEHNAEAVDIKTVKLRLQQIAANYEIERINIYGGEISLLPDEYLAQLFDTCRTVTGNITGVTNLSRPEIIERFPGIFWTVSINDERPNNDEVIMKLLTRKDRLNLSQVVTPSAIKKGAMQCLRDASLMGKSIEFLRYSPSRSNFIWNLTNKDYEDFMMDVIKYQHLYPIYVQNMGDLKDCVTRSYNAYADSNIFIDPWGNLNTIGYVGELEYFKKISDIKELADIVKKEKEKFSKQCSGCPYEGHCYAEHLHIHQKGDVCCGMINLVSFYEKNIHQDN